MSTKKPHKKKLSPAQRRKLLSLRLWEKIKKEGRRYMAIRPGRFYLDNSDKRYQPRCYW